MGQRKAWDAEKNVERAWTCCFGIEKDFFTSGGTHGLKATTTKYVSQHNQKEREEDERPYQNMTSS